jgi:hypothetical protein
MCGCGAGDDGGGEWECAAVDSADGGLRRFESGEKKAMKGVKGQEDLFCLQFCSLPFCRLSFAHKDYVSCCRALAFCTWFAMMTCVKSRVYYRARQSLVLMSLSSRCQLALCQSLNFVPTPFEIIGHHVAFSEGACMSAAKAPPLAEASSVLYAVRCNQPIIQKGVVSCCVSILRVCLRSLALLIHQTVVI